MRFGRAVIHFISYNIYRVFSSLCKLKSHYACRTAWETSDEYLRRSIW